MIYILMKKFLFCFVKVVFCRCCIVLINMFVWCECIILCILDGNVWKWGKVIKEIFYFFLLGLKYLVSIFIFFGVSFFLKVGVLVVGLFCSFFLCGMNCLIENLICWIFGL